MMLNRQEHQLIEPVNESSSKWRIIVNEEWCKGCGFCYTFCPQEVLTKSDKHNSKGYYPPITVKSSRCVGCKLCEVLCPDFTIYVKEVKTSD